jgi:hypothetical protein
MPLPAKKKVEIEMEPMEEGMEMEEGEMPEEAMEEEVSPLAEFDDAMLMEEVKKRGLI